MKKILRYLFIIGLTYGSILQLRSQGYIVPNGVYANASGGLPGFEIDVLQNPTNGNFTGFSLIPQGANTFSFSYYLDEGVRVFLVSSNAPISLQPIQSQSYTELTYPNSYVFGDGSPFYLGLYTSEHYPQNGIYSDPLFGWARLVNNQGVIQLLDSALEYGGGGIYAGTQTIIPVPEPGAFALSALGALLFGFHRWRNSLRAWT